MHAFGTYAFIGFCVGLIWGVGCALVLLYSIYLAGYRKGIRESAGTGKAGSLPKDGRQPAEMNPYCLLGAANQ